MVNELCKLLITAGSLMCEKSLEAADQQFKVLEPVRQIEQLVRIDIPMGNEIAAIVGYTITGTAYLKMGYTW